MAAMMNFNNNTSMIDVFEFIEITFFFPFFWFLLAIISVIDKVFMIVRCINVSKLVCLHLLRCSIDYLTFKLNFESE